MQKILINNKLLFLLFIAMLSGCTLQPTAFPTDNTIPTPAQSFTSVNFLPTPTPPAVDTAVPCSMWISRRVPNGLQETLEKSENCTIVSEKTGAAYVIDLADQSGEAPEPSTTWIYALVAPFPTLVDEIALEQIMQIWKGEATGLFSGFSLWMDESTYLVFVSSWGNPGEEAVHHTASAALLEAAWNNTPSLAIVPFDELTPKWKVLKVDGISPYDSSFDAGSYPLALRFGLFVQTEPGFVEMPQFPLTNRDPSKMTTVMLTGTTALVRTTAARMEVKGVNYPAEIIGQTLREADILHISNEVSFNEQCPPAIPVRSEMRFCSNPAYFELLQLIGTDVIELTGNHLRDWGPEALLDTLEMYQNEGMQYYGGGRNLNEAMQPLRLEHHGNRIAFIGCNVAGPEIDWSTESSPGALKCDMQWMKDQIQLLLSEGYLPIVTFQHYEVEDYRPTSAQRVDMLDMASAGAVIVSGSQSHFPQAMTFVGDVFVHYGLGNLFFDQMMPGNRDAFLDRHIFYNGSYLGVDLLTTKMTDYAQPRWMTPDERITFLDTVFSASNWSEE